MRIDIYPEKAQYRTMEPITLIIERDGAWKPGAFAMLRITRLESLVYEEKLELPLQTNRITIPGMDTEFGGFGVFLQVSGDGGMRSFHTAFDVVIDCSRAIRYGFLSDFHTEDGEDCRDVSNLRKFHINMVQYYDWSYRHDCLVSRETRYRDMMGREVDLDTVRKKIAACKEFGMKSIGYGAVYAASREYYEKHREEALYTSAGDPLVFIDIFYIMNVAGASDWRRHIIEEYVKAVSEVGFDGIHMDTYGFPKTAYSWQKEQRIRLEQEYPTLINDTKARLNEITPDNHLIFNNVGNWPVGTVADTLQDAVYIEVWEPYIRYHHIKQIISDAKRECKHQKPVILAAYLSPFRTDTMEQAAHSAYLLTAAVTVCGAYHLLLGEENAVLTQGYYVDHSKLTAPVTARLRSYYDFLVRYMELFHDEELVDVSMTHMSWDNTEYRCFHKAWSVDAEPDKVWITVREKENRKLISLVNLCGNDNEWNRGKAQPILQQGIRMQVQIDQPIRALYYISPEDNHGEPRLLSYENVPTDRGRTVMFEIPQLELWGNVWIDF